MTELTPLHTYFAGEKQGALAIGAIGLAALGFSYWAWSSQSVFRALVFPLGLLALVELAIAAGLYVRTGPQVATLVRGLSETRNETVAAEQVRMGAVMRSFDAIRIAEGALIAISFVLIFALGQRQRLMGIGMGLLLQASVLLVFDTFADQRGRVYIDWLKTAAAP